MNHVIPARADTSWQEHAACVDTNPNIFFDPNRFADALLVCRECPAKAQEPCGESRGQADGVWGGRVYAARPARQKRRQS